MDISDVELVSRLESFGYDVGPITDTTRLIYRKKLQQFEEGSASKPTKQTPSRTKSPGRPRGRRSLQVTSSRLDELNSSASDFVDKKPRRKSMRHADFKSLDHSTSSATPHRNESDQSISDQAELPLTDAQLRQELRRYGLDPGPINETSRKMYIKQLENAKVGIMPKTRHSILSDSRKSGEFSKFGAEDDTTEDEDVATPKSRPKDISTSDLPSSSQTSRRPSRKSFGSYMSPSVPKSKLSQRTSKKPYSVAMEEDEDTASDEGKQETPTRSVGARNRSTLNSFSTHKDTPMPRYVPRRSLGSGMRPRNPLPRASELYTLSDSDGETLTQRGMGSYDRNGGKDDIDANWDAWTQDVFTSIKQKSQQVIAGSIFLLILLMFVFFSPGKVKDKNSLQESITGGESFICGTNDTRPSCVTRSDIEKSLKLLEPLRSVLTEHGESFFCGNIDADSHQMPIEKVIRSLSMHLKLPQKELKARLRNLIILITHYPHFGIEYGTKSSDTDASDEPESVRWLAIRGQTAPLRCWMMTSASWLLSGLAIVVIIGTVVVGIVYACWRYFKFLKLKEMEVKEVVKETINILKEQKRKNPVRPYVPLKLLQSRLFRDMNERLAKKDVWDSAVSVIDQQEAMVVSGRKNFEGVEHIVWWWQGDVED